MKKILLAVLALYSISDSNAQTSSEFGFNVGSSNYLGDLQSSDVSFKQAGATFGVFAKHSANSMLSFKGFLNYGRLHASDEVSNDYWRTQRNLSFRSHIIELGATAELSALPFDNYNNHNNRYKRYFNFTPYVFGGINLFHFNPKARYQGKWIALQPLNTEGQNSSFSSQNAYSLTQFALPFGAGIKYIFKNKVTVAFEIGARKTFTDYLDDVSGNYPDMAKLENEKGLVAADLSFRADELNTPPAFVPSNAQRGNQTNDDWYMMTTLSISYKLYKN